ncbi:hypothetical protein AMELA_G00296010 [Ameiurus melas]|uniref:MHC class II alpha chain N-terminal domain-containing protein n=1 Tax=Ameiurus melas TaxID=219545 RepID=A0A7J5ZK87_AMEME|nr:hypothetical protein AMELA_G00296010 [Ameiurus melas]
MFGDDGEVEVYADFEKKKDVVYVLPLFADQIVYPVLYPFAEGEIATCLHNLQLLSVDFKDKPLPHEVDVELPGWVLLCSVEWVWL